MSEEFDYWNQPSKWAIGWTGFAGFMLVLNGFFAVITGLGAILSDEFYVVSEDWAFKFDPTAWGWFHLIGGIILVAAGFGIFSGRPVARGIGVVAAGINAIANFAWIPYHPVGAIILIAIDVAVIWALTAHGRDITAVGKEERIQEYNH